ncbi:phosphohydrolase [Schlegelella sp. S2-27]|uniref:Phosphohydrolase n=1 Tax=Caldimonas mangrovi TaxID=2944811 RepID=A0ABT0YVV4_9BURK|nr:HD domain-containing protein [Caldimonas mangrovi]MCM5682880.1 phosphohydrolase [Caldimonas mangrovi]
MDCFFDEDDRLLQSIEALYTARGQRLYSGRHAERVTALEHALQCAQLAEWADADEPLVAAAFLHDLGHLLIDEPVPGDQDDRHEECALDLLCADFGAAVTGPIRLHVAAKRYLCAREPGYQSGLSAASAHTLSLQGGPMTPVEAAAFEALPHAMEAVQLRRWDDLAKVPGKPTPPLAYYLGVLQGVMQASRRPAARVGGKPISAV